jgi:hypothetical protein
MNAEKNQAATETTITVICLERKKEKRRKETYALFYIRVCKAGKFELKNTKPADSTSCLCPFVHLQPAELQCAVGVNVAVWRTDRRRGQSAGQGRSSLSYVGMVGVIATTGQRIFVKKLISA